MANKLYLDNTDHDVAYEPSESEDEYSEEEKEILKEIRQRNKRKPESKKEILAFDDNSDEQDDGGDDDDGDDDIIGDSDIERGDEDDGIPDSKAWGKQRRSYYNTDFVDQDYSAYNEQEEEQAQQEEEEAKSIQLRLAQQLDEADFFLDIPAGAASADEDEEDSSKKTQDEEQIKLKTDLSGLSEREKQQLFEKDSPEFAGLVSDFQTQLMESRDLLNPILAFATERKLTLPIFKFAETRNNLILTYCNNVTIYLLLKAKRIPIKYHPITKRLAQLRKLLIQLQEKYENVVRPQLEDLLEKINSGEEVKILVKPVEKKPSKKLRMMKGYADNEEPSEDEDETEEESSKQPGKGIASSDEEDEGGEEEEEEGGEDVAERRGITYQIAKNKGLMAHRKKELRNPRVKHRSKFRKALIRRKGAVRTVRTETKRYGGEMSGIKATVKKGIKIKS